MTTKKHTLGVRVYLFLVGWSERREMRVVFKLMNNMGYVFFGVSRLKTSSMKVRIVLERKL